MNSVLGFAKENVPVGLPLGGVWKGLAAAPGSGLRSGLPDGAGHPGRRPGGPGRGAEHERGSGVWSSLP